MTQENQLNPEEKPLEENKSLDKPDFSFTPTGNHQWKQQGPYIVCFSCELQHALWIGMEKLMVGIKEDGEPIFKTRKELGMA